MATEECRKNVNFGCQYCLYIGFIKFDLYAQLFKILITFSIVFHGVTTHNRALKDNRLT